MRVLLLLLATLSLLVSGKADLFPSLRARSPDPMVRSITTIKEYGKSLDWSHELNLIAFGKLGLNGYYDVYVMRPDGADERCLTCGWQEIPRHNGNPAWHPSGEYIVFTAEKNEAPRQDDPYAIPGTGINCDLWLISSDGARLWRLTELALTRRNGVIHPQFSRDGKKLFWAERLGRGGAWGEWALKVADFVVDARGPHLENIQIYQPGEQHRFYESHAFSQDGWVLFSGNLLLGQPESGLDIYELGLETGELRRLTPSFDDWDEHAHYSPDGRKIAWMSSSGFAITYPTIQGHEWAKYLATELWLMDADGLNKRRLTYFNEPGHREYIGSRSIVSDNTWSPDGRHIAATVAYETPQGLRSKIVMIELTDEALAD